MFSERQVTTRSRYSGAPLWTSGFASTIIQKTIGVRLWMSGIGFETSVSASTKMYSATMASPVRCCRTHCGRPEGNGCRGRWPSTQNHCSDRGKAVDAKQVGHELGVRYVLEGSVRRVGENITVNAQLISTETGTHVWADRFDGERSKFGQLQVDIVARLANSLNVALVRAESLRALRERPNNPDAVDLAMRGWAAIYRGQSKTNVQEAIDKFEQALRIDSQQPEALVGLSVALNTRVSNFDSANLAEDADRAGARPRKPFRPIPTTPMRI